MFFSEQSYNFNHDKHMFHEHPFKIFKHALKNIWLLIFPILRGVRSFSMDFNSFYTWIKGVGFDVIIILIILMYGMAQWLFTWFRFDKDHIRITSGFIIKSETSIPYKHISMVNVTQSFYLRPFNAAKIELCTSASRVIGSSNIYLTIHRNDLLKLKKHIPEMKMKDQSFYKFRPKWYSMILYSLIFSNTFSGSLFLATFIIQAGRVINNFIQNELPKIYRMANNVSENVSHNTPVEVPTIAIILFFIVIGTWLLSFITNILRYIGFIMKKDKHMLKISTGALTKRIYHIIPQKINYIDIRQNLLMKIFRIFSINISCPGYGKSNNELPVLMPILNKSQTNKALDMMGYSKFDVKPQYKAEWKSFLSYIGIPSCTAVGLIVLNRIILYFLPNTVNIVNLITITAEIPLVWLIIAKAFACFTTGITIDDDSDFIFVKFSRFYAFHTLIVDKRNLVKIQIFQDVIDEKINRCRVDLCFRSETNKVNKVKGIRVRDAKKIIEQFEKLSSHSNKKTNRNS